MGLAKWFKVDFHTHTPVSNCFKDKTVTAEQWLQAAKKAGLDAVVITDHNSVGFISKIDEIQNDDNRKVDIKVFYGIEVCVSAAFTHIIVIFDNEQLSVLEIEDAVIEHLGLKRQNWGETEIHVTEDKLAELYTAYKGKVFIIPAHFGSSKGLGRVNPNELKVYQSKKIEFDAVEVRNNEDIAEYEKLVKNGYIDRVAMITGSDNPSNKDESVHSIEGFGKAFTWVKVSQLSFEGLRQVFIDYEHRCIDYVKLQQIGVDYDPNAVTHNYVSGITLSGFSHMENIDLRFSPYLNCIVGGRGTGKSTLIDAVCYGLGETKDLSEYPLIEKTFLGGGEINTYYSLGRKKDYLIKCKKNEAGLEYSCFTDEGEVFDAPPEFKIDFYGQGDIFNLIEDNEDESGRKKQMKNNGREDPLLSKIDSVIKTRLFEINDLIKQNITKMLYLSGEYHDIENKLSGLPSIEAEIGKAESILSQFKASGIEEARRGFEEIVQCINKAFRCSREYLNYLQSQRTEVVRKQSEFGLEYARYSGTPAYIDAVQLFERLSQSCDNLNDAFLKESSEVEKIISEFNDSDIHVNRTRLETQYSKATAAIANTGVSDVRSTQDKLQDNRQRKELLETLKGTRAAILKQIDEAIDGLMSALSRLTKEREEAIKKIKTDGIKVSIKPLGNVTRWKMRLQKDFARTSYDDDFQMVSEVILSEMDEHDNYKRFLRFLLTSKTGDLNELGLSGYSTRFVNIWKNRVDNNTLSSL